MKLHKLKSFQTEKGHRFKNIILFIHQQSHLAILAVTLLSHQVHVASSKSTAHQWSMVSCSTRRQVPACLDFLPEPSHFEAASTNQHLAWTQNPSITRPRSWTDACRSRNRCLLEKHNMQHKPSAEQIRWKTSLWFWWRLRFLITKYLRTAFPNVGIRMCYVPILLTLYTGIFINIQTLMRRFSSSTYAETSTVTYLTWRHSNSSPVTHF